MRPFEQIGLNAFFLEELGVLEFEGTAVDSEIIVEVIKIFDNSVAPGRASISADCAVEKGAPGAFEVVFTRTASSRLLQHHNKFK